MNWQDDDDDVFKAKVIGEIASVLIKAMGWEKEYKSYKKKMFEYLEEIPPQDNNQKIKTGE